MFDFLKRMDSKKRTIMFICYYAFFCNGHLSLLLGSMMPDLKAAWGLSDAVSGLFISAHSAGNLIAGFISGLVPLYLGQKRSVILLSVLAYIGYAMTLLWGNPTWLILAFLLVGLGRGSITNFNSRMTNLLSGGSPAASNLLHASFAIGAIALPMVFLALRNAISWKAGVVYVVFLGLIEMVCFFSMHLENDKPSRNDQKNRTVEFLRNPSFLILAMMMFCYLCSEYCLNGWLVTYIQSKEALVKSLEASGQTITAFSQSMATLLWIVMLIGRLICAALSSRISQKKMMLFSACGMAAFFMLLLNADSMGIVALSVGALGLCMAGICPMIYSDAAIFTNTYQMATSYLLAIGSIGAIITPTVVGALADRFGFAAGMSAILVTIVLLVVFSVLNITVKTHTPPDAV